MRITLQIENVDRLESGGQVSYSCADRGFDIGRHEHLDWSLPDPHRVISGKHCEVRFEGGQFVLHDISTNGTFLNGSPNRMDRAHALRSGDRLMIGDYIISVALEAGETIGGGVSAGPAAMPQGETPLWNAPQPAAPDPGWPSGSTLPDPAPYPVQESGGSPWGAPSSGMEGRHAPPSSAPGIGTPADDVWSQQGHGWGSADPALYDPQAKFPDREAARPAQADPLDHLASQPSLAPSEPAPASPFPPLSGAPDEPGPPLFDMPDLGGGGVAQENAQPSPVPPAVAEPAAASPFPEADSWTAPVTAAPAATAEAETPAAPVVPPEGAPAPLQPPSPAAVPATVSAADPEPETAPALSPADTPAAAAATPAPARDDFIKAFAQGAGIPENVLQGRDPEEFARELGTILQGVTGDLMGLLQARSQVKAMTRNANRTLISRSGNNALKFSPTPQMALQTMFSQGAEDNGYLPMGQAMRAAFRDIQKHHVWTYSAMQKAAARFDDTLSPRAIEREGKAAKSPFGSQKAKLWERMEERWTSLSGAYDDGLVGVFTQYFTESYEELTSEDPEQQSGQID
ncbi:type VI secretion system-associated FHA domain protein TagH [Labrenzia sp. 011]|uniref:type VI secretion system-associated FHA domain protein TagH n=1 Tax=Labrenzia sp. 011 TaxID=2171494 RepID=UPI000D516A4A|nr:type VI secretion system-associated FHA domain protein TagH [Labrenzia sp. 011]PVB63587.1 type VI secretion system-associated FHA domain protein TagH [Labrenzia sp. 011]